MAKKPQRQPTPPQIDAAQRILAHNHKRVYSKGAKGTTIRALQIALAAQGYAPGRFDGDWGDATQAAFDKFMQDRGQVFGSATPKGLAFISKEIGQPLPRSRPTQPLDGMTAAASGDAMTGPPMPEASVAAEVPPLPSNPSQSAEREYDPNVLHAATMNRNEPADMAEQPRLLPMEPATDFGSLGPEMAAMQPGGQGGLPSNNDMRNLAGAPPLPPEMEPLQPAGNEQPPPDEWSAILGPINDAYGMGLDAPTAGAQVPPSTLRDALIGSGRPSYPAPNQPNILDALRQALVQDRQSKMAGY